MIEVTIAKEEDMEFFENDSGIADSYIIGSIVCAKEHPNFRTIFSVWDTERRIILAIVGMNLIVSGVYEFYVLKSKHIGDNAVGVWKEIKFALDSFFNGKLMHRAQIAVNISNKKYIKFMDYIGFKFEGIMKNYHGDGIDHALLARTI